MSKQFKYKCDLCGKTADAYWNSESWLPPYGWAQLWDERFARCTGEHICPTCRPKPKKPKGTK